VQKETEAMHWLFLRTKPEDGEREEVRGCSMTEVGKPPPPPPLSLTTDADGGGTLDLTALMRPFSVK
jgi:hypothetical protein